MAIGVQISSFFFAGAPALDDIFGYYLAPSSVQIQQLQATVQTAPTGGDLIVALIDMNGAELGRVTITAASFYAATTLSTPITLGPNRSVRAKVVQLDGNATASDIMLNLIGATAQGPNPPSGNCGPSSCGPGYQNVCQPPSAQMLFFPGTQGPQGPQGPAGPASTVPGPAGAAGPADTYEGDYVSTDPYYDTALRRSVVSYGGFFWAATNPLKNGLSTWEAPGTADWTNIGATYRSIATGWKLLGSQQIPVGVNVVTPGFIKSNNFVDGTSGWLANGTGAFIIYEGVFNGLVSTDTPKFNLDDPVRTMPGTAMAQTDIPPILTGDIPVYSDFVYGTDDEMIFYGWESGAEAFVAHRFGNTSQNFLISVQGTCTQSGSGDLGYVLLFYRIRNAGGMWGAWTAVTGQITYVQDEALPQSFANIAPLNVTLTGTQDIQFSVGFAQSVYSVFASDGCTLSVIAYN